MGGGIHTVIRDERFHRSFSFRFKISSAAFDHVERQRENAGDSELSVAKAKCDRYQERASHAFHRERMVATFLRKPGWLTTQAPNSCTDSCAMGAIYWQKQP